MTSFNGSVAPEAAVLGERESRSLQAFQEACRLRELNGVEIPRGVSWSPQRGWSDGWGGGRSKLYHRRLESLARAFNLPL